MNVKQLCVALSAMFFAEAAFAAAAVSYTFAPSDTEAGLAPTNAYSWDAAADWGGSGYPSAVGHAANISSSGLSNTPRFLMLPDGGIDIGGIKGNDSSSAPTFYIVGDEVRIDSTGYTGTDVITPGRITGSSKTFVFAPLTVKSQTSGTFWLAGDWNMTTGDGKVTLSIGDIRHCAYLYANDSNPVREQEFDVKEVLLSYGKILFFCPRGTDTDIVGTWDLTAGSPYVKWSSGTNGMRLPAGTTVTGSGVQDGTFLKRIFNSDWLELSKPATTTSQAATLTFHAFTPRVHSVVPRWGDNGGSSVGVQLNKFRREDVFRLEIMELYTAARADQYLPINVADNNIHFPGTLVLHDTSGVAKKKVEADKAHLELVPDVSTDFFKNSGGIYFKGSSSELRVTVTNAAKFASMCAISNFVGKLVKDGEGTLETGFVESSVSGSVVVEDGCLVMTNLSGEAAATFASLCVSNGAAFALAPGCTLTVHGGTLADGATVAAEAGSTIDLTAVSIGQGVTFKGPGTFVLVRPSQLSSAKTADCPNLSFAEQGTARDVLSYDDVVPEVVGHPAFWVSADKNVDIISFQWDGNTYNNGVACWRVCRDGETTYYATNDFSQLTTTTGVPSRWYENGGHPYIWHIGIKDAEHSNYRSVQSGMVWNQPITNICAVFSVVKQDSGEANAILGCTKRFEAMGSARTSNDFRRGISSATDGGGIGTWSNYLLSPNAASCVQSGWIYADGVEKRPQDTLAEFSGTLAPVVLEMHPTAPYGRADAFAIQEHGGVTCSGCQRQMECIIYTNELTQTERMKVCAYLLNKWKGTVMRGVERRFTGASALDGLDVSGGVSVSVDDGSIMGISSATNGMLGKEGEGVLCVDLIDGAGIDVREGELVVRSLANNESAVQPGQFIHLDATKTDTMEFKSYTFRGETIDTMVETWRDPTTNIYAHTRRSDSRYRPGYLTYPEALGGKPVVDYSTLTNHSSNAGTVISDGLLHNFYVGSGASGDSSKTTTAIGSLFVMIGSRNGGGVPLGSFNGQPLRDATADPSVPFYGANAPANLRNSEGLLNGRGVTLSSAGLSGGYDTVAVRNLYGSGGGNIDSIMTAYTRRYTGGGEIGELIIYETPLPYVAHRRLDAWLGWKWLGRKTVGFSPMNATSVAVADGATLSIDGDAPVTTMAVSGAGTVNGSLVCAEGCVVTAKVTGAGGVETLSVTGSLDVSRGGTVAVVGDVGQIGPGAHPLIAAGSVSGDLGEWTVTGVGDVSFAPQVRVRGGALCLVMPSGLMMIIK